MLINITNLSIVFVCGKQINHKSEIGCRFEQTNLKLAHDIRIAFIFGDRFRTFVGFAFGHVRE